MGDVDTRMALLLARWTQVVDTFEQRLYKEVARCAFPFIFMLMLMLVLLLVLLVTVLHRFRLVVPVNKRMVLRQFEACRGCSNAPQEGHENPE